MVIKTYKILVSFGDGKPVESTIEAQNGILAQDKALAANPGARSIRILGVVSERVERPRVQIPSLRPDLVVKPKEDSVHPLFTDVTVSTVKKLEHQDREQKIKECKRMHQRGLSHKAIASELGVGKTTVGSWLKLMQP